MQYYDLVACESDAGLIEIGTTFGDIQGKIHLYWSYAQNKVNSTGL
jgi:hypothetical protein